tara:strand:- start:73 stop:1296 length:1224 start_codon:yes stop_codon:yes gene_type:complete
VKSFKDHLTDLTESKNLHMEHLEDSVFNEGSAGVKDAINFANAVADMLDGSSSSGINVTVKWDGAPAVFCGVNPDNGKFFVGSKSIFNKTPKINYTNADIDENHGHAPGLSSKLKVALKYLKDLGIKDVLQGDIMFTDDVSTEDVNGESCYVFTPNTITYAVPVKSKLGKKIKAAKIGVVFHTKYSGSSMDSMSASFNPSVGSLRNSKDVWYQDADFRDTSGTATFTASERSTFDSLMKEVASDFSKSSKLIDQLYRDPFYQSVKLIDKIKILTNRQVRGGSTQLRVKDLIDFLNDTYNKDRLKKTTNRRTKKDDDHYRTIGRIKRDSRPLEAAFRLHDSLTRLKILLIRKLEQVKGVGTFIKRGNGFDVTAPEGFVAVDRVRNKALKLVDRLEFSRANFTVAKNWT